MTTYGAGRWAIVLAAALTLELLPSRTASAQPIRVLLVMPRESGELSRQVARLDDAIAELNGPLVAAKSLADADVVVQFTRYQRKVGREGEPQDWWSGQFKLLVPPARIAALLPTPERFGLMLVGQDKTDARHTIEALARMLSRAVGRQTQPREAEPI